MSTSPTKGNENAGAMAAPSLAPSTTGRRGHAHRRSAAISSHDLSLILKPSHGNIGGSSAPTSPSTTDGQNFSFPGTQATSRHRLTTSISDPVHGFKAPASPPDSPRQGQSRVRVGFSDTLEYIPRPLSLVSSETSSTVTARPGHSVSGSISSIMSGYTSPQKEPIGLPSPAHSNCGNEFRPSTADAVVDMPAEDGVDHRRHSSLPAMEEGGNVSPAATSSKSLRNYFFGHSDNVCPSPSRSRPVSASGSDRKPLSAPSSPVLASADSVLPSVEKPVKEQRPSLTRKPSKKQKKVKSWGSILSRKTRPRSKGKLSRRSPTPPLRNYGMFEATAPSDESTDNQQTLAPLDTSFSIWKPRHVALPEDEIMSPMIDLDAALGPFNTPTALSYDPQWEASQRTGQVGKRRMHSGGPARMYRDPFHRRSESAPEMDNPRFAMHRLGSSSTMADVFEEDEEDDWEETRTVSHKSSRVQIDDDDLPGVSVIESDSGSEIHEMDWSLAEAEQRGVKRKGSGLSEGDRRQVSGTAKSERSATSLKDEPIAEESESPVEIFGESVFPDEAATGSSNSTVTPPLRANNLTPVDIKHSALPQPFLTPASPQSTLASPFPSPRSPMSYDTQRISTAASSYTSEAFESLLLGEPGPEVRMSVDDVPSLTSSASTMTRDSTSHRTSHRNGQRSASLSAPSIQRKRTSIASLSRLLHSSHGEKSPLSMEISAPASPEKKGRTGGKGKRISRMMQFWKTKDAKVSSNS